MGTRKIIFLCGTVGAILFAITSIIGGLQIDGYNVISQYISESYATGIPNAEYLQYAFIASGILLFLFGLFAPSVFSKSKGVKIGFFLFAIFYGLGTVSTGFFPCDLGCPSDPADSSISQLIHNTSGFLTYCVVPLCLIGLGAAFRKLPKAKRLSKVSFFCGIMAFVFVLLLFGNPKGSFIGILQRIIETSILSWVIYCSFYIIRTPKD